SSTCAARPSASATSPTTSHGHSSKPAASDPAYTLHSDEPDSPRPEVGMPVPMTRPILAAMARASVTSSVGEAVQHGGRADPPLPGGDEGDVPDQPGVRWR